MADSKRAFIFGAGFSKPAGMPLATELLPLLVEKLAYLDEMRGWLEHVENRLAWLVGTGAEPKPFLLNIEEVFHRAHFDIEAYRLRQHLSPVGRRDGPATAWNRADSIDAWISYLEHCLCDVILECDGKCDLASIVRWATTVQEQDAVLTFNYDTLVERALAQGGKAWSHGTQPERDTGIPVCKLHGSVDWIVAHRNDPVHGLDLLFDKKNENQSDGHTGSVEDDYRLWRCRTREQLKKWIKGRDVQSPPDGALPKDVGIAGLGAYKELHKVPGLGQVWTSGMQALHQSDVAIVVGFSMSDFDAMAQMQFADVARTRLHEGRPLPVLVIDPYADEGTKARFRRVFRFVDFVRQRHEDFNWSSVG